jgi:hypothetical protein
MKIRPPHLAATAFALLILTNALFAQTVTLRYHWTKGEELRYRYTQQTQTSMSGPQGLPGLAGGMSMDQKLIQTIRIVVDDVAADGTVTLRQIVEGVRIERNMPSLPGLPAGNTVFDTSKGDAATAPDQVALAGMVGKAIKVVMSPTGAVLKMEGMKQIMDDVTKNLTQNTPAAAGALNSLSDSFDDESLGSLQRFAQFPDRALKPGDAWDRQRSMTNPITGKATTSETYALQRIDGNVAHIKLTSTTKQESPGELPGLPNMQMQMRMDDTTGEGELLIDVTKGRLQRSGINTTGTVTMTMSAPSPNGAPANITMSTKTTTSILMELIGQ